MYSSLYTSVLWSSKFHLPLRRIPVTNPNNLPLDSNTSKIEQSHHAPCARIHTQMNKLDFISISPPLLHSPLMEFTTWLGRISSGLTWTLLSNYLPDLHKIYENLLHHRSNDLYYLVACQSQSLFRVQLNIRPRNYRNLWLFHNRRFRIRG